MLDSSFVSMCLSGDAILNDIDKFVESWHESDSKNTIEEYLGMSKNEYNAWVLDDSILPYIIRSRRENKDISQVYTKEEVKVAARGSNAIQVIELFKWLKEHGD